MKRQAEKHCSKGRGETQSQESTEAQDTTMGSVARGLCVNCADRSSDWWAQSGVFRGFDKPNPRPSTRLGSQ